MPSKPSLSEVQAANASSTWSNRPTAVFVGGTSGLGEATARALATATKESQYDFIQCEVSNMKNIVDAAQEIRSKLSGGSLNYLVLSQGIWLFVEPKQVLNGIDLRLFVDELMPLLEKAAAKGEDARVMTVLNPNGAETIDVSDLGRKTTTSGISLANAAAAYSNVMIEEYQKLHPNLGFYNIFPGLVSTPNMKAGAWWTQPFIAIARVLLMIKPEESGERMLSALLNPEYKTGGFYLDQYAAQVSVTKENEEVRKAVLDHYRSEVAV
ncbi:hypothetical protein FRC01_011857 [Tulasnella sp. 417]|nr:hypothetical protein FRC01_011857 [Tulasnella sp. 417]